MEPLLTLSASKRREPIDDYRSEAPRMLPEFRLYRPKAGHPDWPRLLDEAKQLAAELRPTLAPPEGVLDALKRRGAAYATTLRNYIENRALDGQGREDLRPLYFIWTTSRICNFACTYCDDHQGHKYPDLPNDGALTTEQGIELLRIMRTRTPSLYFAGGEPTVRKDLPEWTAAAHRMSYYPIIINTNGSLIARNLRKPEWTSWLAQTDIVIVSLDGLDLRMLSDMWVYRKPHEVLRNLLLLRELRDEMRVKLTVNCMIEPGRIADARAMLDLANDLRIWFCPVPVNIGPAVDRKLHADPEYADLVGTILERKRAGYPIIGSLRMNERLLKGEPLSCRNTIKPHIDFDGSLVWPCKASMNVSPRRINVPA